MRLNRCRRIPLAAAGLLMRFGFRRQALEQLFARTAAAFGAPVPPSQAWTSDGRLLEYARFTRTQAEAALRRGDDLAALDRRLHRAAYGLGARYRLLLGVRSVAAGDGSGTVALPGSRHRFPGLPGRGGDDRSMRFRANLHPAGVRADLGPRQGAHGRPCARRGAEVPTAHHRRRRHLRGLPRGSVPCVTAGRRGPAGDRGGKRGGRRSRCAGAAGCIPGDHP